MPKKSNKTDHVLNLLTSGSRIEESTQTPVPPAPVAQTAAPPSSQKQVIQKEVVQKQVTQTSDQVHFSVAPQSSSSRVIVEESKQREDLSNLVKLGLEEELKSFTKTKTVSKPFIIMDENDYKNPNIPISKVFSEEDMEFVTSKPYILEDFDENEEEIMSNEVNKENKTLNTDTTDKPEEFLHNMAEDIIKSKAPEIMESLNMCTCKACIYDVVALALNNTQPLYTVTKKGELFQKLASCEMQYGSDITREITKACLKIKINPRHEL